MEAKTKSIQRLATRWPKKAAHSSGLTSCAMRHPVDSTSLPSELGHTRNPTSDHSRNRVKNQRESGRHRKEADHSSSDVIRWSACAGTASRGNNGITFNEVGPGKRAECAAEHGGHLPIACENAEVNTCADQGMGSVGASARGSLERPALIGAWMSYIEQQLLTNPWS